MSTRSSAKRRVQNERVVLNPTLQPQLINLLLAHSLVLAFKLKLRYIFSADRL
jgi:hypothetical protein